MSYFHVHRQSLHLNCNHDSSIEASPGISSLFFPAFASALCIMVAAKAGAEMLVEKPELSIWSLLFVALGEGLAIYGLIVAILLSG